MKTAYAFLAAGFLSLSALSHAGTIPLASTMNGSSYMAEDLMTGGFSRINLGTGASGDRDGHYAWNGISDPATISSPTPLGSGWDLFPNETSFVFGSITYDDTGLTGIGVETADITAVNLGSFWTTGSSTTDISDTALDLWFFGGSTQFTFGGLSANDTVTFTNGVLTSINLSLTTSFSASAYGNSPVWNGTFSITSGSTVSYDVEDEQDFYYDDEEEIYLGTSTLLIKLGGTVNAVGSYTHTP